ncbi:hypothetical protein EK21DRAFT_95172 [Setomelanomma holmii]|uniref:Uncharacterized protein n=1 Tax=Setomelanomma holmii TaxID=210430 RepID=A0A9P4GW80_9PLEO|nr:hypothetical protein EK21DRAFT_95172 [Setomelanomma holmii]
MRTTDAILRVFTFTAIEQQYQPPSLTALTHLACYTHKPTKMISSAQFWPSSIPLPHFSSDCDMTGNANIQQPQEQSQQQPPILQQIIQQQYDQYFGQNMSAADHYPAQAQPPYAQQHAMSNAHYEHQHVQPLAHEGQQGYGANFGRASSPPLVLHEPCAKSLANTESLVSYLNRSSRQPGPAGNRRIGYYGFTTNVYPYGAYGAAMNAWPCTYDVSYPPIYGPPLAGWQGQQFPYYNDPRHYNRNWSDANQGRIWSGNRHGSQYAIASSQSSPAYQSNDYHPFYNNEATNLQPKLNIEDMPQVVQRVVAKINETLQAIEDTQPRIQARTSTCSTAFGHVSHQDMPSTCKFSAEEAVQVVQLASKEPQVKVLGEDSDVAFPNLHANDTSSMQVKAEAAPIMQALDKVADTTKNDDTSSTSPIKLENYGAVKTEAAAPVKKNDRAAIAKEAKDTATSTTEEAAKATELTQTGNGFDCNASESSQSTEGGVNLESSGNSWDDTPVVPGWDYQRVEDWTPAHREKRPRPQRRSINNRNDRSHRQSHSSNDSTVVSPPTKRIKEESVSVPANQSQCAAPMRDIETVRRGPAALPVNSAWGNYEAHIKQDDQNLVVKVKEDIKRNGGETYRPEIKESYKDKSGKKETTVHEKVGGKAAAKQESL